VETTEGQSGKMWAFEPSRVKRRMGCMKAHIA